MKKSVMTMKQWLCMIIVAVVMIIMYVGEAKADTYGYFNYTVNKTAKTTKIDSYTGDELEVEIPSKLGGYKVTEIGDNAFSKKKYMQEVIIPNTVKRIGNYAFQKNTALKKLTIPDSVTTLSYYMCGECTALETVTIGKGVKEIPNGAFRACTALTTVKLSSGLKKICGSAGYYGAFGDCTALKNITIPNTVTEIAEYAFSECTSLPEIVIPDSVKTMGSYVFSKCKSMKKITIGTGLKAVPDTLAYKCSSLTDVVFKGNNIVTIEDSAFAHCTSLTEIILPKYVDVIDEFAFYACKSLKTVKLNEGLMTIRGSAFADCTALEDITIPSSVINYTAGMFRGCKNLKNVLLLSNISTSKANPFASVQCKKESIQVKAYSNNEFIKNVNIGGDYTYFTVVDMDAIPSTKLAYSKKSVTLAPGGTITLPATMTPADSTDSIMYESSNSKIITVNQRGKITAVGYGTATITARTNSNMLAQLKVNVAPKKVEGFKDTDRATKAIKFQWNEQAGVDGYDIYRKASGKWKFVMTVVAKSGSKTNNCLVNKGLAAATNYQFKIHAYKTVDGAKIISPSYPTVTTFTAPAKVTNFKKSKATKTAIKTTWKKTKGATGYIVYRYQSKKWVKVGTTSKNYYTFSKLKKNTTYKFCVKPYRKASSKVANGDITTLTTKTSK